MNADVVVAGAGLSGFVAALSAQEAGASVIVLEKAVTIGGSAAASGATLWCADNLESWLRVHPDGDPRLGQALIDNFYNSLDWLRNQGLELASQKMMPAYTFPHRVYKLLPDARGAMEHLAGRISEGGGTILTSTPLREIQQNAQGQINKVRALGPQGFVDITTSTLVLATGGFQANPEMRARYFGRWANRLIVRSNPYSTGDGLTAALNVGAATAGALNGFYGHMVPAPPAEVGLHNFLQVKPNFGKFSIFVNLNGERFVDEYLGDEITTQAAVYQPKAVGILIYDEAIRCTRSPASPDAQKQVGWIENIRRAGGEIVEAPTLKSLGDTLTERFGVHPKQLLETLTTYNSACVTGDTSSLTVPKSGGLDRLETPPFYAIPMLPGITFTYGGIRVNDRAEVLDSTDTPIKGLYAAGADAGGIFTQGYSGGLGMAMAYGRIAGKEAAAPR